MDDFTLRLHKNLEKWFCSNAFFMAYVERGPERENK